MVPRGRPGRVIEDVFPIERGGEGLRERAVLPAGINGAILPDPDRRVPRGLVGGEIDPGRLPEDPGNTTGRVVTGTLPLPLRLREPDIGDKGFF